MEEDLKEDPIEEDVEDDVVPEDEPVEMPTSTETSSTVPESSAIQPPSSASNLNDEDAKCYSSRYQDIDALLDPKSHYSTVGIQ